MRRETFPLSRHDIDAIHREITRFRVERFASPDEIVISSRRAKHHAKLDLFGLPVRVSDTCDLNEGKLLAFGQVPFVFDFEDDASLP